MILPSTKKKNINNATPTITNAGTRNAHPLNEIGEMYCSDDVDGVSDD